MRLVTIGVNLRKNLRLDKHLSISMTTETVLYQINGIRSFLVAVSIARHGVLALQIPLIAYYIESHRMIRWDSRVFSYLKITKLTPMVQDTYAYGYNMHRNLSPCKNRHCCLSLNNSLARNGHLIILKGPNDVHMPPSEARC